jgi:2-oxoisovalerate dehydrogenase E1 component
VSINRVEVVERRLESYLKEARANPRSLAATEPLRPGTQLTAGAALELFECQLESRALDVAARELKKTGRSFYTISSAGHENNALLGRLARATDPAFLHYRSGAFMLARQRQLPGATPVFDTLLSLTASAEDPISGGRHKVWGSRPAWVPPQTSTIASHLPKAVGAAFALGRRRRLGLPLELPPDSVVLCSFGDASANHATALAGFNAARYSIKKGNPTPILFVCEDNGIGISVATPRGWIEQSFAHLPHLHYFHARGDLAAMHDICQTALNTCRALHVPVFLHLETVRLWGHAGSDVETTYRSLEEIEAIEAQDPLLQNARLLVESGAASPGGLLELLLEVRARVNAAAEEAAGRRKLETRAEVMAPLALYDETRTRRASPPWPTAELRRESYGGELPEERKSATKRTLAQHLNAAFHEALLTRAGLLMFGEDVGKKGGVYGLTAGLQKRFGVARVFDTLLDETTILGLAQGSAQLGLLPVPEIQYLAYVHNALDQLRGEACSLSFFSNGQFANPMVVRIAGLAYQKGFGGHFHNDNSIGALRDIPGLALCVPARGDDAVKLWRGALNLAEANRRVVVFLEPIALYHERDLYADKDDGWLFDYPAEGELLLPGELGSYGPRDAELLIVTYGNGLRLSLRAARQLEKQHGVRARVIDLRWLAPLPLEALRAEVTGRRGVLVVDECRATAGGPADALLADWTEQGLAGRFRSVRAADSYVPLGGATDLVLVTEAQILSSAQQLLSLAPV